MLDIINLMLAALFGAGAHVRHVGALRRHGVGVHCQGLLFLGRGGAHITRHLLLRIFRNVNVLIRASRFLNGNIYNFQGRLWGFRSPGISRLIFSDSFGDPVFCEFIANVS